MKDEKAVTEGARAGEVAQTLNEPGSLFDFQNWGSFPAAPGKLVTGLFTGNDSTPDVVLYRPNDGTLWVGRAQLSSFDFGTAAWDTLSPASGWEIAAGDVAGNSLTDIVAYHPKNGTLWVGENLGLGQPGSFSFTKWATIPAPQSPACSTATPCNRKIAVGDFTDAAKDDVALFTEVDHTLQVARNMGTSFSVSTWATISNSSWGNFGAANFGGDAKTDVVLHAGTRDNDTNKYTVWVGINTNGTFEFTKKWDELDGSPSSWSLLPSDIPGDGRSGLLAYHNASGGGELWAHRNTGLSFWRNAEYSDGSGQGGTAYWASLGPVSTGWSLAAADFTNDLRQDVAAYDPNSGTVWMAKNLGATPEGYVWPLSGAPGDTLSFKVSDGDGTFQIFRYTTDAAGATVSTLMGSGGYAPVHQPMPASAWSAGCGWANVFSITIPSAPGITWPSGLYSVKLKSPLGRTSHITFVVKPKSTQRSTLAVLANVNTWLAYSTWGGKGKYNGAPHISYLRPNTNAAPIGQSRNNMQGARGELWILGWLTALNQADPAKYAYPDLYTDLDLHNATLPTNYRTLVVGTHPEYWTEQERDNLEAFLNRGGRLLYLGGNGMYERATVDPSGTSMTFLEGNASCFDVVGTDACRTPALFRVASQHERETLGTGTEACNVTPRAYVKSTFFPPEPPRFTAIMSGVGSTIGDNSLNNRGGAYNTPKASSWEVDTKNGPGSQGLGCNAPPPNALPSTLPPNVLVVASAKGPNGEPGADMTYYDRLAGGSVFTTGSITFGGSLHVDANAAQVVKNVLTLP